MTINNVNIFPADSVVGLLKQRLHNMVTGVELFAPTVSNNYIEILDSLSNNKGSDLKGVFSIEFYDQGLNKVFNATFQADLTSLVTDITVYYDGIHKLTARKISNYHYAIECWDVASSTQITMNITVLSGIAMFPIA